MYLCALILLNTKKNTFFTITYKKTHLFDISFSKCLWLLHVHLPCISEEEKMTTKASMDLNSHIVIFLFWIKFEGNEVVKKNKK